MAAVWLPFVYLGIGLLVAALIYHELASFRRRRVYVTGPVLLMWAFAATTVLLIPSDIQQSSYEKCLLDSDSEGDLVCEEPFLYVASEELQRFWQVIYWTSFVATYTVFPVMSTYVVVADFGVAAKLRRILWKNGILFGVGFTIIVVGMIVLLAMGKSLLRLVGILMHLSNLFSLTLIMIFLGYGISVVPRTVWYRANLKYMLRKYRWQTFDMYDAKSVALHKLRGTLRDVHAIEEVYAKRRRKNHEYVTILVNQIRAGPFAEMYENEVKCTSEERDGEETFSKLSELVELREDYMKYSYRTQRADVLYNKHVDQALFVENILEEKADVLTKENSWLIRLFPNSRDSINAKYRWFKIRVEPILFRILAIFLLMLSLIVIWSECMLWSTQANFAPNLSVVALLIVNSGIGSIGQLFFILVFYIYIAHCTFHGLFRMRLFNLFRINNHQQTDARSLLFSANWVAQFSPVLAYNFLVLSTTADNTAFQSVLSTYFELDWSGVFNYYYYLPFLMLFVAVSTLFSCVDRCLGFCGMTMFQFEEDYKDVQEKLGENRLERERRQKDCREQKKDKCELEEQRSRLLAHKEKYGRAEPPPDSRGLVNAASDDVEESPFPLVSNRSCSGQQVLTADDVYEDLHGCRRSAAERKREKKAPISNRIKGFFARKKYEEVAISSSDDEESRLVSPRDEYQWYGEERARTPEAQNRHRSTAPQTSSNSSYLF